jgi:hypothetical protein
VLQATLLESLSFVSYVPYAPPHQSYESHTHPSRKPPLQSARRLWQDRLSSYHTSVSATRPTVPSPISASRRANTHTMRRILHKLMRVPEAPRAHIQPLGLAPSDQVFGVERRVFGGDAQVSQHDVADVLRAMHGRSDGCAVLVLRRGDGCWEGERHFLFFKSFAGLSKAWAGSAIVTTWLAAWCSVEVGRGASSLRMRSRLERIGIPSH